MQGAVNSAAIPNSLPGSFGGTIPGGRFGEAAINLGRVLDEAFGDSCLAFTSIWMHSRSSTSERSNMQDYVGPAPLETRTCAAAGTKFLDLDADGVRDPGEPGVPRFQIFADYDGDGVHDPIEPFTLTDEQGDYVLDDIRPPGGSYTLREALLPSATPQDWQCSFPTCRHPRRLRRRPRRAVRLRLGSDQRGRRAVRARPRLRQLGPGATDRAQGAPAGERPGPLRPLGERRDRATGSGRTATRRPCTVQPGTHTVAEAAVPPDRGRRLRLGGGLREPGIAQAAAAVGATTGTVTVTSGASVVCTFRNTRKGSPGIAIDKTGPATAERGDVLHYTLYVTNVGTLPFAAADVAVTDPRCDERPELEAKRDAAGADDPSPETLDPGDTWIYRCSRTTEPPGDDCVPGVVRNTATVNGSAGGSSVEDSDSIDTVLTCPAPKVPGIAIEKVGPGSAPAGSTLTFFLNVYNVGEVAFKESAVDVTDSNCDAAPEIASKLDGSRNPDASPATLDPGDVWVYSCTRATSAPGADCQPTTVSNTGSVRGDRPAAHRRRQRHGRHRAHVRPRPAGTAHAAGSAGAAARPRGQR